MKKFITLFLILGLVVSLTGVAMAKDNIIFDTQSSSIFSSWSSSIGIQSGEFKCEANSYLFRSYDQSITMELQKYNGGWNPIKTWETSNYSPILSIIEYYPLETGIFRVKSIHQAGGETKYSYSDSFTY